MAKLPDDDVWVAADDIAAAHHRRSIFADRHYGARLALRIAICKAIMAERLYWRNVILKDGELHEQLRRALDKVEG